MRPRARTIVAALFGAMTHVSFAAAIASMAWGLASGMQFGLGRVNGRWGLLADLILALQFPLLHSWLLSRRGSRWLMPPALGATARTLWSSSFAWVASLQILAAFWLWTPSHVVLYRAQGLELWMQPLLVGGAWCVLLRAIGDDDPRVQSGFLGWSSLYRGQSPDYRTFSQRGLYQCCRHPIYLGFALCLWVGPVLSFDKLLLAVIWSAYCALGPKLKERRYFGRYGVDYARYRDSVPYLLPRLEP